MSDNQRTRWAGCLLAVLLLVLAAPAAAHETDQYTLPPDREFAEVGPYLTRTFYDVIARGVADQNARIRAALQAHASRADLQKLQAADQVAASVNSAFPVALFFIESLDSTMTSDAMKIRYPGRIVGYKPFVGVRKNVDFGLNPMRAWQCATIKCFGVYMGDDKIGHFTDMGMHYYTTYLEALRRGVGEQKAVREAIAIGTDGPVYSEKGLLGLLTAGAYSNGDLVANYMGFCFYRNLSEPLLLKGESRPALLYFDGQYWRIAPHVRPDSDFFSWFISDHMNEALNPSSYRFDLRGGIRKAVAQFRKSIVPRYADANGNLRSPDWFAAKTAELKTYWGFDYGHDGDKELIRISDVCFAPPPDMHKPAFPNGDGLLPMHYAAMKGDIDALQKLLDASADPNVRVTFADSVAALRGDTPLHLAAREGKLEAVALLLSRGASAKSADDRGVTPLHMAVRSSEVSAALIAAGADVDAADVAGRTPLHWAANDPASTSFDVLLGHNAKTTVQDRDLRTPLHLAARTGHLGVLCALIRSRADVDAADRLRQTPLHLAAAAGPRLVDELLTAGASVDPRDDFGCTPLHVAVRADQGQVVSILLAHAADSRAADAYGGTPQSIARRLGFAAVAQFVQKYSQSQTSSAPPPLPQLPSGVTAQANDPTKGP